VLCVVVLSVPGPLSLQAAMPKSAIAESEARISFFMTVSLKSYEIRAPNAALRSVTAA
jgi:hypothetical protein